ncbi:MAG: SET domain-containing protein [Candidatus Nomurabacteria bacterium]|nr:MAG: SET domain-containing protein [Candidatus Nomurabacteria bacterium]
MENIDVNVKKTNTGLGLFANRDFKKGDFIIEYTGEKISEDEANRRGGKYLFELNDEWTIDAKGRENLARYINHSCKPNSKPEIDDKEEHIFIYATKKIKVGDEITYNYGKWYLDEIIGRANCQCTACLAKRSEKGS